jgi:hypothetical protein
MPFSWTTCSYYHHQKAQTFDGNGCAAAGMHTSKVGTALQIREQQISHRLHQCWEPNMKPGSSFYLVVEQEPEQRFWGQKNKNKKH